MEYKTLPIDYAPSSEGGQTNEMAYADGWNDCIDAMKSEQTREKETPDQIQDELDEAYARIDYLENRYT